MPTTISKLPLQKIRIATRKSALALWQANFVASSLKTVWPGLEVSLVKLVSQGDQLLDIPLNKVGGKGLFVKELERALQDKQADIAVHSMKDVPMELPKGLCVPVICKREDPRDAFIAKHYSTLDVLPQGATVGTSSLRRQCQLLEQRPDLTIKFLRGNVNTRLNKLDQQDYDAIILAAAGLSRLNLSMRINEYLPINKSLPAAGQGAIGIEVCSDNHAAIQLIEVLHDAETALCVDAEREMNRCLNGSCQIPIASYACLNEQGDMHLRGLIGAPDASVMLRAEAMVNPNENLQAGRSVANELLVQGADKVLADLNNGH